MGRKPTRTLDVATLKTYLHYNPETGIFTRRIGSGTAKVGDGAGYLDRGYVKISLLNRRWYAHRLAWLYMTGTMPTGEVDHENGDHADNTWTNLRNSTSSQNMQNQQQAHRDSFTGILGVTFDKARGKYMARIIVDRRTRHLGRFATAEEAGAAYVAAKRRLHPFGTI